MESQKSQTWSLDRNRYDSNHGLSLIRADEKEWEVYYSIYEPMDNASFPLTGDDRWSSPGSAYHPFWIMEKGEMVGGVRMAPQYIQHLFIIPPFMNVDYLILNLIDILQQLSDASLPIHASEIVSHQWDAWSRVGFRANTPSGRWMQRPTHHTTIMECEHMELMTIGDSLEGNSNLQREKEIAFFIYNNADSSDRNVFQKNGSSLNMTLDRLRAFISKMDQRELQASSIAFDRQTRRLIGVCLIQVADHNANVLFVSGHEGHSDQGVISYMLKHALARLKGICPVLSIYIQLGDQLEGICYRLGFHQGPLQIPMMTYKR